jgi:uncharacterized protein YjlB
MSPLIKTETDDLSGAVAFWLASSEWVPNNPRLPAIHYRGAIDGAARDPAASFEAAFQRHGWPPQWRNGVYAFHHYHSNAHEVLGFAAGTALLMLGGPNGPEVEIAPGDCLLLPAGTGHRRLKASDDFLVVGCYPPGVDADLKREAIPDAAKRRMVELPFPASDPVLGSGGPLSRFWNAPGQPTSTIR